MKKFRKTNGLIVGSILTTSVLSVTVPTVHAAEEGDNYYGDLIDLMNLMDRLYDSIESDPDAQQDIKEAKNAFITADDDTWDQILSEDVLDLDGVTDSEKKALVTDGSKIFYADTFASLKTGIEAFRATYNDVYPDAEFSAEEMLDLIAAIQLDGFSKLQDKKDLLKELQDEPNEQLSKMIELAYEVALEDIKNTDEYEVLRPKVKLDIEEFIKVVLGVKVQMPQDMKDKVVDAQAALLQKGIEVLEQELEAPIVNKVDENDTVVTGKALPGAKVTVELDGENVVWTGNADGETGEFSISVAGLDDGDKLIVTQTDVTGKASPSTAIIVDRVDEDPDPDPDPVIVDPDPETPDPGDGENNNDLIDLDPDDRNVLKEGSFEVNKEIDASGKVKVKVQIDGNKVAESIADKSPDQVQKISVKINKEANSDVAEVSVPSKALDAVKAKNEKAIVEVVTDDASYNLPVNEVNTEDLAAEFGSTSDDVEISIQVSEVDNDEVEGTVTQNSLKPVSKVIEFKVEARTKDGSKSKEIKRFKQYVERSIVGEEEFDMTHSTAVRLNEDGTFTSVPTLFEGTKATIKSMTNSKYTIVENDKTFSDVEGTWNEETIEKLASKYIIQGKLDGTYAPKEHIKRSEFTTLISRALGLVDEESDFEGMFPDVKEGKWYAQHVEAAVDAGIIQGREDGTFDPDSNVTRNETAAMIKRAMNFVTYDKSKLNQDKEVTTYKDYDQIAKWSRNNVELLLQADIMSGRGNGNFDPYGDINRAEMAKVLDEFLSFVQLINE